MTSLATTLAAPDAATLKAKERERRAAWPQPFALRIHRAVSWLGRAEREPDDRDAAFIRAQVSDCAKVLGWLTPIFIDIMMDHPTHDWGRPSYPVVE
jgi:hypothetical protein